MQYHAIPCNTMQYRYISFSVLFQTKSSLVWKSYTQKLRTIFQTNSSLVWKEKNWFCKTQIPNQIQIGLENFDDHCQCPENSKPNSVWFGKIIDRILRGLRGALVSRGLKALFLHLSRALLGILSGALLCHLIMADFTLNIAALLWELHWTFKARHIVAFFAFFSAAAFVELKCALLKRFLRVQNISILFLDTLRGSSTYRSWSSHGYDHNSVWPAFWSRNRPPHPDRGGRFSLFLTMRCLPILNDAMFRQCFEKA